MTTLADRDQSLDRPCKFCSKPLWRMYESPFAYELSWGHVTREDAYHCTESRRAGVWPVPEEKEG